jgi:hypothetical protein
VATDFASSGLASGWIIVTIEAYSPFSGEELSQEWQLSQG